MALAWAAAAWIAGVAAATGLGLAAWPLAIALSAVIAALALVRREPGLLAYAAILPLIFTAGLARVTTLDEGLRQDDVASLAGGPAVRIRGVVRDDPDLGDATQRFAVSVRELQDAGAWRKASGGVQVTTELLPRVEAGDVVELEGQLEPPAGDAGFDYAAYLARLGIHSALAFPAVTIIGHDNTNFARRSILVVRRRVARALELALPEPQASLAQGVLLGRRSALPRDLNDDLNATNTSHLVVVSGANVVLVAAFATAFFSWAVGRRRALMLSFLVVLGYMLLVGTSPPVVRGTIMGLLVVLAQATGRRANGVVSIAFAAALMLGIDPRAITDVSFQLSFAATMGIIVLAPVLHDWLIGAAKRVIRQESLPRPASTFLVQPLATTIAAVVATQPLVALNFGRVSLVAIPANMLVVPLFPYVLAGSAIAAIGGMAPRLHLLLAAPAYYALSFWIWTADRLASVSGSSLTINGYSPQWTALTYAGLAIGTLVALKRLRPAPVRLSASTHWGRLVPFASVAVPVAGLVASAAFALRPEDPGRLEVTVLDVGEGDAILIEAPSGRDILIDGGPGGAVLQELGRELPWPDRSIELLVLTHPQADHLYGLLDVLPRYDVQRAIAGPGRDSTIGYREWLRTVSSEGLVLERPSAGQAFDLGDGVVLEVLGSPADGQSGKLNNTSLVLKLVIGKVSFLFTGDIEADAEAALVASGVDLRATVLKVPHHGSKTSSSTTFLDAVGPSISVISAGKDNQFGHPAKEVVDRLSETGTVLVTSDVGAVHFETDGVRLWVSTSGK